VKFIYQTKIRVGKIVDDTYYSRRSFKVHFYRIGEGYPISVSILNHLKATNVKFVIIIEYDRNVGEEQIYRCNVSDYDSRASFKWAGHDEQKCVPLRRMEMMKE